MPIDALPDAPLPSDSRSAFSLKQFAFQMAMALFRTQANALEANVELKEATASAAASTATASAATAQAAANYKGEWSALTGALNMPASVSYGGFFYALNANLANVTTAVPGVASQWTQITTQDSALVVVSTTTVTAATGQTLALANGAATAVTAPASPCLEMPLGWHLATTCPPTPCCATAV